MPKTLERAIGRALRSVRAGDRQLAARAPRIAAAPDTLRLGSPAFADGAAMPERHAGAGVGQNLSPPLTWSNVPPGTAELVLVMQDPDAPLPWPVVHLIALGLKPDSTGVAEAALTPTAGAGIAFGAGSFGRIGYAGPRPPRGHGPHRYIFQLFAVARPLAFPAPPSLAPLLASVGAAILARGELIGTFERR